MSRDILSGFGRDSSQPQRPVAGRGGILPGQTKDVNNYQAPQGPKGIMEPQSPGLHGVNNGPGGVQGGEERLQRGGSPGLGGVNHGCCGSQGRY